jgi:hypothetical protein
MARSTERTATLRNIQILAVVRIAYSEGVTNHFELPEGTQCEHCNHL